MTLGSDKGDQEPIKESLPAHEQVEDVGQGDIDLVDHSTASVGDRGGINASSQPHSGVVGFLRSSWAELNRVKWPDRQHIGQATLVVVSFTIFMGLYLGLLDAGFSRLVEAIL